MSVPTSTLPRKRQPRRSVWRSKVSSSRLISWWSGATPPRSSPHGVGRRSIRSTSTSPRWRLSAAAAKAPAGPAPTIATRAFIRPPCAPRCCPARAKNSSLSGERVLVLLREIEVGEDRVDRARLDARVAVDADGGVDVELLGGLEVRIPRLRVDAVDRTDLDARVVLDAAADDDVRHGSQDTNCLIQGEIQRIAISTGTSHAPATTPRRRARGGDRRSRVCQRGA